MKVEDKNTNLNNDIMKEECFLTASGARLSNLEIPN